MRLKGERVLLTGGAGGLGALIAAQILGRGGLLTVIDRAPILPFDARHIQGDLSTLDGIGAVAKEIAAEDWDVLINLAGVQYFGPCEQQTPEGTLLTYMVNLVAPTLLTQAVLPSMKLRRHGRLVNIGSIFGSINFAHFVTYSSSKAGLRAFSQGLRRELSGSGVTVTYVAPRAVKTSFNSEQVLQFARLTHMKMDEPKRVARRIVSATMRRERDVYLGFPESFFVKLNAVVPSVVDGALEKNDRRAAEMFAA